MSGRRLVRVAPPFRQSRRLAGASPEINELAMLQLATWLALVSAEPIGQVSTSQIGEVEALPRDPDPAPRTARPRSPR